MVISAKRKRKIEVEETYRNAVAASISGDSLSIKQKHGVPLILSVFIPGLGQVVKGQVKKGLLIFFAPSIIFIVLIILNFFNENGSSILALLGKIWLGGLILYIWQLIDVYNN